MSFNLINTQKPGCEGITQKLKQWKTAGKDDIMQVHHRLKLEQ